MIEIDLEVPMEPGNRKAIRSAPGRMKGMLLISAGITAVVLVGTGAGQPPEGMPPPPPARQIPGLTAADPHPGGCVDCHVVYPELNNMDTRFSTMMSRWVDGVEPKLLAQAQAAAPEGITLKGNHPRVAVREVPSGCLACHGKESKSAPPFARMIHEIHLVGGNDNTFMTVFQGECTHCHKLNQKTGAWTIPSGPEKAGTGS
jgi:hypothetical protein